MHSVVLGEEVQIAISLPFGYSASDASFPLLFGLDGDAMFGFETEVPRLLSFEGKVPPMIVAAVIYGNMQSWIQKRQRDYHPADGGADRYLKALKTEILPFLAAKVRVSDTRILYGHSSGGLFAVYAGLREPALFSHILATSPSLEEEPLWAADFLQMIEASRGALPAFYLSADASEGAVRDALTPVLSALEAKETRMTFQTLAEGSHMAVIPKSFTAGLLHFFVR